MKTWFMDFETFYTDEYSLRKMTPVEYILDPRFEAQGCAIKEGTKGKAFWLDGPDLPSFFGQLDRNISLVTHNALFDASILAWRYDFNPRLLVCTMSISREVLGHKLRSVSLEMVSRYLGLGSKGGALPKVKGLRLAQIKEAGLYDEFVAYGVNDCDLCAGIYGALVESGKLPVRQLFIEDMVLRCAIEPKFMLDQNALALHLNEVLQKKDQLLAQAMLLGADGKTDLMSNDKFAALLRSVGCEPPTKISPATGLQTYAFAKSDADFIALEDDDNPAVQALVGARLGHKSTLEETRTTRLQKISHLTWPGNRPAALLPVPLNIGAAHTHRLGGAWSLNLQNLPARKSTTLRRAMVSPPGHKVVTVDSSQIQARLSAWACGQTDLVEAFGRGEDVYSDFASGVFERPINKKDNPSERFVGKTCVLGSSFGLGWLRFQAQLATDSLAQTGSQILLSDTEAKRVIDHYRERYAMIPKGWRTLTYDAIPILAGLSSETLTFGACIFEKEHILLPSGLHLHYVGLDNQSGDWWFTYGGKPKKLWGGTLLENIAQALEQVIIMEAALRIRLRFQGFQLQSHDELVYIVRDDMVEDVKAILTEEMNRRLSWCVDLPLASEIGVGLSYGAAK